VIRTTGTAKGARIRARRLVMCRGNFEGTTPDQRGHCPAHDPRIDSEVPNSGVTASRLVRLLRCTAVTARWLRYRSLHSIAIAVAAHRDLHQVNSTDESPLDVARGVVAVYDRLRPLVLTKYDRRVHDFLTLVGLLPRTASGQLATAAHH